MNTQGATRKRKIKIERTYKAPLDDVWDLWTTKDGIEAWWGPDGFSVKVHTLDLRASGQMRYAMTASGAPQIEFMKRAGMPLTTETLITFTEVTPKTRLAYDTLTDFIQGIEPYQAATLVELFPIAGGVKMVLTIDAMHSEEWTQRAVMGWESELGKLEKLIAQRGGR
ncbi:MAG TPA: SRPBCC domain-containing protein [Polyangiaceae bacterium]|nr:SRPBCC domain-containing protein [Polyangiaceae bacterium]